MPGWVTLAQALKLDPDFLKRRRGQEWVFDRKHRRFHSPFGFAEHRVQLDSEGKPAFGRVVYGEAPNINAVVYGLEDGVCKIAVVSQLRPFADLPTGEPSPGTVFGQPCVMGFRHNWGGLNMSKAFEAADDAAIREALEEVGAKGVVRFAQLGHHNPNPTFCATWSELFEIEVDLATLTGETDRTELIYKAEYVPLKEILRRIAAGEHDGVNYRSATANNALFVWLSSHPEFWAQLV